MNKDIPLLIWVDDPALTHEQALTKTAQYIISLDDELGEHIRYLLRQPDSQVRCMCGSIYLGSTLSGKIDEITKHTGVCRIDTATQAW